MAGGLKRFLNEQATTQLGRLGYSDGRIRAAKRAGWWWATSRAEAIRRGRSLMRGSAVVWTEPGRAECVSIEVPRAGHREVSVAVSTSVVSPGTERAQYLRLPSARIGYPHRPGYSAAGTVLHVGAGVRGIVAGDLVAVVGASHASVATVPAQSIFRVPEGVSAEDAAFVQLGVICGQAVRRAEIDVGVDVCIFGSGAIGLLAQRLATANGSGATTVIARSRSKEPFARHGGVDHFLTLAENREEIRQLEAPVIIEATGDPDVLAIIIDAAAVGARVILLGSPRGVTRDLPLARIRAKRVELIGAHVETLRHESRPGFDAYRHEADAFLGLLAARRVRVDDLAGPRVDPREADFFYRRLARERDLLSARFDWLSIPPEEQLSSASWVRPPQLFAYGVEVERPVKAKWRPVADPFVGAVGMLRIGLVGCGDIAIHNARAIATAPNARLATCFDPNPELAEELAKSFGADPVPTYEALLERKDVDAVFIAVPHHLDTPLAAQAAAAGKHVIVEKPLAETLSSAVELAAAVERAGVVLSVCFPHRYGGSAQHARALVQQGAIGDLAGTLVNFFADKPPSYWVGGFSGRATSTWRSSREQAGGGVLIMNLSHLLDLIRHITGAEVDQCAAVARVTDGPAEVEDTIALTLQYTGGAVGSVLASSALRGRRGGKTDMHVWGSDGYIVVEPDFRIYTSRVVGNDIRTTQWQAVEQESAADIRAVYVSRLASALERGEEPDVTAADGIAVQAIIEAAYRASDTGQTVRPRDLLVEVAA